LSAAGKTTVSQLVHQQLSHSFSNIVLLDGDQLRRIFLRTTDSYSRESRVELGLTYSRLIKELVDQGVFIIIAVIGLYHEIHVWNRSNLLNYRDVLLDVPIEELQRRDPKGLYNKSRLGHVCNLAGVDFDVDFPRNPFIHIQWNPRLDAQSISAIICESLLSSLEAGNDIP